MQTVPLTGAVVVSTGSEVALQDARKALEMFHQVNVEVLGLVENMSPDAVAEVAKCWTVFGAGGTASVARQYNLEMLGTVDLDPAIRQGGDRGKPVALAGADDARGGAEYYRIAEAVVERAAEVVCGDKGCVRNFVGCGFVLRM